MNRDGLQNDELDEIEKLREKMIAAALVYGINHQKVLSYSQEIDKKHNFILKNKLT
ncbi:aspartyl-phosphate phosphatase Spo0E family protein [Bacillaceae bacterium IKA-2]|nr:aspartyl-phosphate phosphatase Spo0E family protein [Bacillaceae bacterium IKA-2]